MGFDAQHDAIRSEQPAPRPTTLPATGLFLTLECARCDALLQSEAIRPEMLTERWAKWWLERIRDHQAAHVCEPKPGQAA